MAEESMPRGEIVGIVIGAVALFSLISFLPMAIMWQHRRRAASRRASEILHLTSSMEQVSVERWLEQQNVPGDTALYCQDMCAICLSSLSSSPYPSSPEPAHLPRSQRKHDAKKSNTKSDSHHNENCVLVLSRCHHAFHLTCLTSWVEYRHYKCPICKTSYFPDEVA